MRTSGVLLHLTALPSSHGIGTLGQSAYEFVDFLRNAGQRYWQILPIGPTSYGDSPYQSFSTYAGNPYLIDLDLLADMGLLLPSEYEDTDWEAPQDHVNYGVMYEKRYPILKKAVSGFESDTNTAFHDFQEQNASWLSDYAMFMALKDAHDGKEWLTWEPEYRIRQPEALQRFAAEHAGEIRFWEVIQYLFFRQYEALKGYANQNGIRLIGDCPIYVPLDSADVWTHPDLFLLEPDLTPKLVSGCPPDGYAPEGQLWGTPVYDWQRLEETGYDWWIRRIDHILKTVDVLRIDHFRGFESFYAIPYGSVNAVTGSWMPGPGMKLFRALEAAVGEKAIIAEDLGFLTEEVHRLLRDSGYPGMKVLQFAFGTIGDRSNPYLPDHFPNNCIAYVSTHDNETMMGWLKGRSPEELAYIMDVIGCKAPARLGKDLLRCLENSAADTVIVTIQDLLQLDNRARFNTPSTLGGNWDWRLMPGQLTGEIAAELYDMTASGGRL